MRYTLILVAIAALLFAACAGSTTSFEPAVDAGAQAGWAETPELTGPRAGFRVGFGRYESKVLDNGAPQLVAKPSTDTCADGSCKAPPAEEAGK